VPRAREDKAVRVSPVELVRDQAAGADRYRFSISSHEYTVEPSGKGVMRYAGQPDREFSLPGTGDAGIVLTHSAMFQGDLLLLYHVAAADAGSGALVRLDGKTLGLRWNARIPGFNIGPPLIYDGAAYVTCIGFVGKIELRGGRYLWRNEDLYDKLGLDKFWTPAIRGKLVVFRGSSSIPPAAARALALEVDAKKGKVLRVYDVRTKEPVPYALPAAR
jgi:hypothetical protein